MLCDDTVIVLTFIVCEGRKETRAHIIYTTFVVFIRS